MPVNLELKASITKKRTALKIAETLHAKRIEVLRQTDTYFNVAVGRLKLREIAGERNELIYYRRPNRSGVRYSHYSVVPIEDGSCMKALLTSALGVRTVVRKKRTLFIYRNSRIHIDSVEGLGDYLELEVQVQHGKRQARRIYVELRKNFSPVIERIVPGSYSDIIEGR
jgi:predicted adenylyl cyclase CyaB